MTKILELKKRKNKAGGGRKVGTGKFGEPTKAIRIPATQEAVIVDFLEEYKRSALRAKALKGQIIQFPPSNVKKLHLPLFLSKIPAGFPSPADDYVESELDINEYLVSQPSATFYNTVEGTSMVDVGLLPGDKAVVNRSKQPKVGDIILAVIDGEFTIKRLGKTADNQPILYPENKAENLQPIHIEEGSSFDIWGVVTGSFRRF